MPLFLCNAAANGDIAELTRLVQVCKADVNSSDYDRRTALHVAASAGNIKVVQWLVGCGANLTLQDRWGSTALDEAKKGSFDDLVVFLSSNPDPNSDSLKKAASIRF